MKYRKGYKYQLAKDEYYKTSFRPNRNIVAPRIRLNTKGIMRVREGYVSDGPSGPTFDRKTNLRAGVGHDALYQLMRMGLLPCNLWRKADRDYGRWLVEGGSWEITSKINVKGLSLMRGKYAKPENRKKVYEV